MQNLLLPDEQKIIDELEQLCRQAQLALSGAAIPCFAHLRIDNGRGISNLLLGRQTLAGPKRPVTILHWQTAPLAALFFSTSEGESYELEVAGRTLEGTVLARHLLDFQDGMLVEVITQQAVLSRRGGGPWQRLAPAPRPLLCARQAVPGAQRIPPPWTRAALDAEQRQAVERPAGRPLLVLGEAGCGKTTVALHRLAFLRETARRAGRPFLGLVLVPTASLGLRHFSQSLLEKLNVLNTQVQIFDRWAAVQARRAFSRLPRRESRDVPAAVIHLKRHPALGQVLAELACRPGGGRRTGATRQDLLQLFGDRVLVERVARAGGISASAIAEVLEHTRIQFSATAEEEHAHVDAERLSTVDGRLIDDATPLDAAGTIDVEDYAVLFALSALRGGPEKRGPMPTAYDCVVVDEAQEFAPLELALIGRALRPGGTLIVAGDEVQQVDPSAYFAGWDATMHSLAAADFERQRLLVSYRCPPAVTRFARALRGEPDGAPDADSSHGAGADADADNALVTLEAAHEFHLLSHLIDSLRQLREQDPQATIAVICRTFAAASRLHQLLVRGIQAQLVHGGNFSFVPGIQVTCVKEVKGLEFDYVVVPDAAAVSYPENGASRRALYVAVTRASAQLLLAWTGHRSPLLAGDAVQKFPAAETAIPDC